jgi:hypothetical protein
MSVTNALAYYHTATIMAVNLFIVQSPGAITLNIMSILATTINIITLGRMTLIRMAQNGTQQNDTQQNISQQNDATGYHSTH